MLFQHAIVFLVVAGCTAVVTRNLLHTFRGVSTKPLGSCCSKGCAPAVPAGSTKTVFLPVELLARRKNG
jgi:hypothetical protein